MDSSNILLYSIYFYYQAPRSLLNTARNLDQDFVTVIIFGVSEIYFPESTHSASMVNDCPQKHGDKVR